MNSNKSLYTQISIFLLDRLDLHLGIVHQITHPSNKSNKRRMKGGQSGN